MKHSVLISLGSALALSAMSAQDYEVVERGPHHAVWERQVERVEPDGTIRIEIESYTERATGLHYWDQDQWKPSVEEIAIVNGVAVAERGQHKVIFPGNLSGQIDLLTPDNVRLKSQIAGLLYTDRASGESIALAAAINRDGAVLPPNQVYYLDAFDTGGGWTADARYTYTKAGL